MVGAKMRHEHGQLSRNIAFALDIDGVLCRGPHAIAGASIALKKLRKLGIPHIFLTNGGGQSEDTRTKNLSQILGVPIDVEQFIQSHTPFKSLVNRYENVLVLGGKGDSCQRIAQEYGFRNTIVPNDILRRNQAVWPLSSVDPSISHTITTQPIDAILVFHDPRDWGRDTQLIVDCISGDMCGSGMPKQTTVPDLVFSNDDFLWSNDYPEPRFGQGAFRRTVEVLYKERFGSDLKHIRYGKPFKNTYEYANGVLKQLQNRAPSDIYMIGASDIAGAAAYGWKSILVESGVWKPGNPTGKPTHIAPDVREAVDWALAQHLD